jgi:N-acetyl-gamma-glutamyl-phosphate reductase
MYKIFIHGESGTTGLRLRERLMSRSDIELLQIPYDSRRDENEIREYIAASNITFLCLPDDAAIAAVALAEGTKARIIDTSTAHRIKENWDYGLPELSEERRRRIIASSRVSVPGCHASGFIAMVYPLVEAGVLPRDYPLSALSLTGYSGGGKSLIAEYEDPGRADEYSRARAYSMSQSHKHLPEMTHVCGLDCPPVFTPVLEDIYSGMMVTVPLHTRLLNDRPGSNGKPGLDAIANILIEHYRNEKLIRVTIDEGTSNIAAFGYTGRDDMEINVSGNDDRVLLTARFDNLGKGASGAAIQCMNLMIGADETTGLCCANDK